MRLRAWIFLAAIILVQQACSSEKTAPVQGPPAIIGQAELKGYALPDIKQKLERGEITSEGLVNSYTASIHANDWSGLKIFSVLSLNPDAVATAKERDAQRARGEIMGPLHGIPVLLKDNIESRDNIPTTAGSLALKDNFAIKDSPLVAGLREDGAIILGKTNLSEWANFRSNDSMSGWSALGGQVKNPHMLDRNPCGSSSGSGAAVAASFAAGAVGTETNGSIICPSTVNGIVGFKPTVGLISQSGIIPISSTQDTAGPMTKTVEGAALMLTSMASGDKDADYVSGLDGGSLEGLRIGVLDFAKGANSDIHELFERAVNDLENAGATIVRIEKFSPDTENFWGKARMVLDYEFKSTLNAYLASTPDTVKSRSLTELIAFNEAHAGIELALFDQSIFKGANEKGDLSTEEYVNARTDILSSTRENGIDFLLAEYGVSVLVSPSGPIPGRIDAINGDVWPSWAGAGWMAAIAGYPHLTVPMGEVHGLPVGISFIGAAGDDAQILSYGYAYEQATNRRVFPRYLTGVEELPEIETAMHPFRPDDVKFPSD